MLEFPWCLHKLWGCPLLWQINPKFRWHNAWEHHISLNSLLWVFLFGEQFSSMWWSRSFPSCGFAIPGNSGCSPASRQTGEEVKDRVYPFLNHVSPGVASIRCSHPTGKLSHLVPSSWKEGWGMRSLYRHSSLPFHLLFFLYLLNSYSFFKALLCFLQISLLLQSHHWCPRQN